MLRRSVVLQGEYYRANITGRHRVIQHMPVITKGNTKALQGTDRQSHQLVVGLVVTSTVATH